MKRPVAIYLALVVLTILACISLILDFQNYNQTRNQSSLEVGEKAGERVAGILDSLLFSISERAVVYSQEVSRITTEEELLESLKDESLSMKVLLGVTVAFEPGKFLNKERFAPFYNKARDTIQFVENTYDYTDSKLETAKWYTGVIESSQENWSDTYYAEAAEAMVVDYGVPLFGAGGDLIGMVDYTIMLSDFTRIVDSLSVGESGYGFTYDANGSILTHPNSKFLLQNVFQLKDGKNNRIIEKMRNDSVGVVQYNSTYTYNYSWFFFRELKSTGWRSVLVFAEDDLLGSSDAGRRKIINISIGISTFIISLLLFAFRVDRYSASKLWWTVISVSLIIIVNIVSIWYLNLTTDFSRFETDKERIVNESVLENYIDEFDDQLYLVSQSRFHKVPTGLFIESYELTSFEASLIGKLWMKYPKDLYESAPPAFYFPDVSALESRGFISEIIAEVEHDDFIMVTWKFRVTLEQDFSYQQFPFEQNDIEVVVLYPDLSKNVLLIPDLESYDILNPSVKPALNQGISVPSSETVASFFTFKEIDYRTNFGNSLKLQSYPALRLSIVVKRIFLSPFIANIIPIMIVALIMFIVLYISSNNVNDRSGLNTMNVVQSSAGFLFILLLAHVNERNRIETPEIAYIELFYFSMYVFITFEAIALAMLIRGTKWKIFKFQDNLILKLLFWPALLSIWFVVTLLRFY